MKFVLSKITSTGLKLELLVSPISLFLSSFSLPIVSLLQHFGKRVPIKTLVCCVSTMSYRAELILVMWYGSWILFGNRILVWRSSLAGVLSFNGFTFTITFLVVLTLWLLLLLSFLYICYWRDSNMLANLKNVFFIHLKFLIGWVNLFQLCNVKDTSILYVKVFRRGKNWSTRKTELKWILPEVDCIN